VQELLEINNEGTLASYIRPGEKGDVFGTVARHLRQNLKGSFKEEGDFSFREYFADPRGRVVSIETPEELKRSREMFAALMDRANSQALDSDSSTRKYFIYDELGKPGPIANLDDLSSRGLKQGVRLILGIQTMPQLIGNYGQTRQNPALTPTAGITNNIGQIVCYKVGQKSGEWVQGRLGERDEVQRSQTRGMESRSVTEQEVRRYPVSTGTIDQLEKGKSLIVGESGQWWISQWQHPDTAIARMADQRGRFPDPDPPATPEPNREPEPEPAPAAESATDGGVWDGDGRR